MPKQMPITISALMCVALSGPVFAQNQPTEVNGMITDVEQADPPEGQVLAFPTSFNCQITDVVAEQDAEGDEPHEDDPCGIAD